VKTVLFGGAVNPSFSWRGQTSLIPELAVGSATPTFTRASTAYQTDFEGKLNLALSGEARFQGARRVRNYFTATENLTDAAWVLANATEDAPTITGGQTDPSGGSTAIKLAYPAVSTGYSFIYQSTTALSGVAGAITPWLKGEAGGEVIYLMSTDGASYLSVALTLTNSWRRYNFSGSIPAGAIQYHQLGVDLRDGSQTAKGAQTIYLAFPQIEDVTGQTNQNPSEYVSVGVLSAPYHGANVDGVKYFDTLNGNTVASNVVTEATGAAITSAAAEAAGGVTAGVVDASGPLGYLAEGARTNAILQSNTLGTTWTISHADDMNAVAADAYVSVDGTTTMDKLQPKATTAVHSLDQAFTFTAAKYTASVDLRYVAATPQRWVAIICNDGTTTWGASFDLLNGVVGAVSAGATSAIEATALTGVYRCSVTNTANAAAAAGTVKISLNATDTATLESAARAGTETLGAGFVQHEIGTFASTYIPTTTVAVARNADVPTYASAGNVSDTAGAIYAEFRQAVDSGIAARIIGASVTSNTPLYAYNGATTKVGFYDGTNNVQTSNTGVVGTVLKVASSWSGSVSNVALNGTVTAGGYDGALFGAAAIAIGTDNGSAWLFGTIRNVRVYGKALSAAKLTSMTS
jgi:hypothetical protein